MHRIVKQALKRYSEDRVGMVDYALESGGVCAVLLPGLCTRLPPRLAPPTLPAYAREAAGLGKQGWKAAAVSQPRTHNEGQGSSSSLKSG